jgi:hypothetical protein
MSIISFILFRPTLNFPFCPSHLFVVNPVSISAIVAETGRRSRRFWHGMALVVDNAIRFSVVCVASTALARAFCLLF